MLAEILDATRQRVEALPPMRELTARAADAPPPRDFVAALAVGGLSVIAEVKRRSPSRGDLQPGLDPAVQAKRYAEGGAAALSVLTEPHYFSGSSEDLVAARGACGLPVLRKDFTLVPAQVWEARAIGADAVLLIVAALTDPELRALISEAEAAGVVALVEVHTVAEADRALAAGAQVVGVNNRDLASFEVGLDTAEAIAPLLDDAEVRVAESGIHHPEDAARMAAAGYDAVLVGEALVRADDPADLIGRLSGVRT